MPGGIRVQYAGPGGTGLADAGTGGNGLLVHIAEKSYADAAGGRRQVLREVAFGGKGGEVIAVLAPSGAGKTTILRIILGLDRDFSGEVRLPPGQLGVMFQEPRLLPWLTVEANLRLTGRGDARQRAALLADLGLAGTEGLHPKALSLGMARRVALARALLGRPAMLVTRRAMRLARSAIGRRPGAPVGAGRSPRRHAGAALDA